MQPTLKSKPKPKKKPVKKVGSKTKSQEVLKFLKARYGKGWTARKIKAELKGRVNIKTWPTKKTELLALLSKDHHKDIVEILNTIKAAQDTLDKLTKTERSTVDMLVNAGKRHIRTIMFKYSIDLPSGYTTDPEYWTNAAIKVISEIGVRKAKTELNKAHSKISDQDAEAEDRRSKYVQRRDPDRDRGRPINNTENLTFKKAKLPNEYKIIDSFLDCLLYTSPSPRDQRGSRMPSSA